MLKVIEITRSKFYSLSGHKISKIALIFWFISLSLPGLILYSDQQILWGFSILMSGWLGPFVLNISWYANLFFLYAIFSLVVRSKPATKTSIIAIVLAVSTFTLNRILLNEGGATTPVYGYGLGAIFWFIAMFLILIASDIMSYELARKNNKNVIKKYKGVNLLMLFIASTTCLYLYDRIAGNVAEQSRLGFATVIFKRGFICPLEGPIIRNKISLRYPLEVEFERRVYPFGSPEKLLEWGIPVVRFRGDDYFYTNVNGENVVTSKIASGPVSAVLLVSSKWNVRTKSNEYKTTLTSADGKTLSFTQTWKPEQDDARHCPEYSTLPRKDEDPRRSLMAALDTKHENKYPMVLNQNNVWDKVVRMDAEVINKYKVDRTRWEEIDIGCPPNYGLIGHRFGHNMGSEFLIDDKSYYVGESPGFRYNICEAGFVYLYKGTRGGKYYHLAIQKRTMDSFNEKWFISIKIPNDDGRLRENRAKILTIREMETYLVIELIHDATLKAIKFKAPLPSE